MSTILLAVAISLGAACGNGAVGEASACQDSALDITAAAASDSSGTAPSSDRVEIRQGGTIDATGSGFSARCDDPEGPDDPLRDIGLFIVQGDRVVSVARVSADEDQRFAVSFGVPPDLVPGPALVVARPAERPDDRPLATARFTVARADS